MKFQKMALFGFLLVNGFVVAHDQQQVTENVQVVVNKCVCGPTEHWFYKACVKNYNTQFADVNLPENYNTEGLSENVLQAIEMLAADMQFVDGDGNLIIPTVSAKGNVLLPMSKNADYVLCKDILHHVDITTTLSAQELYQEWLLQLQNMKSAQ